MSIFNIFKTKANPTQLVSKNSTAQGTRTSRDPLTTSSAYRNNETVNRGVNILVDSAAAIDYDVKDATAKYVAYGNGMKKATLHSRLNVRPNPFMDISTFRRLIFMDLVMEGYMVIYYDKEGQALYHVPAASVQVVLDDKKYINHFKIGDREYSPDKIIYVKDNGYWNSSLSSTGFSRLSAALDTIKKLNKLKTFKEKFYDNGAVLGLIIETDAMIGKKRKQQYEEEVAINHNPRTGKSNVLVLDGGFKAKSVANTSFRDLGVAEEVSGYESAILKSLGIPPIIVESGNNANIKPNIELLYSMTIMPMVKKFEKALEFFFNFDIKIDTSDIMALAPDRESQAKVITALVNNGIITGNEGRQELRRPVLDDEAMNKIRIPQNVAGSGTGVSGQEGGKPPSEEE